jgi:hypothetical protein
MSVQTLKRKASSPVPCNGAPDSNPIARPSLNAWISAVIAAGRVAEDAAQGAAGTFAAPAPRKPASPAFFKLSELESPQRSIPTPRAMPTTASASAGLGSVTSGGPAGSPPCSQQRSMLGFEDGRKSEDSIPGAFSPWQQPRQVGFWWTCGRELWTPRNDSSPFRRLPPGPRAVSLKQARVLPKGHNHTL